MSFTLGHQTVIDQQPTIFEEKIREDCCDLCKFIDAGHEGKFVWKACELAAKRCFERSSCNDCKPCGCFKRKSSAEFRTALDLLRGEV